ncbi:MAG: hypothetical protein M3O67_00595 [Bacteroidota bacterium]|nr:hypothetical protein [Bacteroidota bacterium]
MKKLTAIFFFLFSFSLVCLAQKDSSFQLLKIIKGDIVDFTVDILDNIYILTSTDQLKKIDAKDDSIGVFNNVKKFGKISVIDVSNPLKVLLYYKDFSTIVILDRLLNIRNAIDLRNQNIFQVTAICLSYDGKVWLYDEIANKLKKIDEDGTVLNETPDLRSVFTETPAPQQLFDQDGQVYLYDTAKGIFVFDYYGSFKNKIPIINWQNLKVIGKYIFGVINNRLNRYQISTFSFQEQPLAKQLLPYSLLNFTSSRLYAFKKDSIEIYSLH